MLGEGDTHEVARTHTDKCLKAGAAAGNIALLYLACCICARSHTHPISIFLLLIDGGRTGEQGADYALLFSPQENVLNDINNSNNLTA